jgi:hypothetical protein
MYLSGPKKTRLVIPAFAGMTPREKNVEKGTFLILERKINRPEGKLKDDIWDACVICYLS